MTVHGFVQQASGHSATPLMLATQIARALDPAVQETAASAAGNRAGAAGGPDLDVSVDPVSCWVDYAIRRQ